MIFDFSIRKKRKCLLDAAEKWTLIIKKEYTMNVNV